MITHEVKRDAAFLVKINWPGESNDDVDLYLADPLNEIVYFRQKQIGLMNLDRDDTGRQQNMVTLPDGRVVQSEFNEEQVNIRGIIEGEYVVNVHMYRKIKNNGSPIQIAFSAAAKQNQPAANGNGANNGTRAPNGRPRGALPYQSEPRVYLLPPVKLPEKLTN